MIGNEDYQKIKYIDMDRFYKRDPAGTSRPVFEKWLFAVHPAISSILLDFVSRPATSVETQNFVFPVRQRYTIGIPVLWKDHHVLLAFMGDEYPQGTISWHKKSLLLLC